jgi:ketosteroid isomerase-like protein
MKMAKIEAAMRVTLAFNDAFNRHDVPAMMALMSEDCVFENTSPAPDGARYVGKAAVTQFWQDFFSASPQARIQIEDIFGLGWHCVMRCAGATTGWTRPASRAMCAAWTSSRSRMA